MRLSGPPSPFHERSITVKGRQHPVSYDEKICPVQAQVL